MGKVPLVYKQNDTRHGGIMKNEMFVRLFGLLLLIVGAVVWFIGFAIIPVSFRGISMIIPLHFILIGIGGILILLPVLPFYFIASMIPGARGERFYNFLEDRFPPTRGIAPSGEKGDSVSVVGWVKKEMRHRDRRYYATLSAVILLAFVGLPLMVNGLITRRVFNSTSLAIANMVQNHPVAFSAADDFRQQLTLGESAIQSYRGWDTATEATYRILEYLFGDEVTSDSIFYDRLTIIYAEEIDKREPNSTHYLTAEAFDWPCRSAVESLKACQSYITLLASTALVQGRDGQYFRPYVRARQLATAATTQSDTSSPVPAAYNVLGMSFLNFLMNYDEYHQVVQAISRAKSEGIVVPYFDEDVPFGKLRLALLANTAFESAIRTTPTNFTRASYLQNSVLLRIMILARSIIDGEEFDPVDEIEVRFLANITGDLDAQSLAATISSLDTQLQEAISLASRPEIFFTRAQLYSIAGQISALGMLDGTVWSDTTSLRPKALASMGTAYNLGLPRELFLPDRASSLRMEWLWSHSSTADFVSEYLAALGHSAEE